MSGALPGGEDGKKEKSCLVGPTVMGKAPKLDHQEPAKLQVLGKGDRELAHVKGGSLTQVGRVASEEPW